jgi:E3 ubiquitin-protein ligase SHPRH
MKPSSNIATPSDTLSELYTVAILGIRELDPATNLYALSLSGNTELHITSAAVRSAVPTIEQIIALRPSEATRRQEEPVAWSRCSVRTDVDGRLVLRGEILWATENSFLDSKNNARYAALLATYLPPPSIEATLSWSPQDFYENVHVPPSDLKVQSHIKSNILECSLYPFQQRAVQWLLQREGAQFTNGSVTAQPSIQSVGEKLPSSFHAMTDANGKRCYVSHIQGLVLKNTWSLLDYSPDLRGGILAEEMGLGKTVELIALTCLHKRSRIGPRTDGITNSGATLIITPAHILTQWKTEIATHAPHLRVLDYQGMSSESSKKNKQYTVENLLEFDIVLTTYNVLAREIHYADTPPERSLRHAQRFTPRRSPLVLTNWWRVCLDEAQMIESGVSQAAKVARLIPRVNAWAVSGTPLKKNVDDLFGLLIFLKYEPYCNSKKLWHRVDKATFKQVFGEISLRHTKHKVAHELRLPPQKRMVITMPFTAVEEQNYTELFKQMCDAVGLNSDGSPAREDFDPTNGRTREQMRDWLRRLRETCLHPQVGRGNRKALGRGQGPLRTVGEVLEVMIEANETELRMEERKLALAQVLRGHIIAFDKSNTDRSKQALEIYQAAMKKAQQFVDECRNDIAVEKAKLAADKAKAAANSESTPSTPMPEESTYETDAEGKDTEPTGRLATLKKQLRSALEVLHVCNFFVASAYFQIKDDEALTIKDSEAFVQLEALEAEHYEEAKLIRKEMLQESHSKASKIMRKIANEANAKPPTKGRPPPKKPAGFTQMPEIPVLDDLGGIESRKSLEKVDAISDILDRQAARIREWRSKIVELLLKPLVDEEGDQEKTGDEYEDSTKLQDELYVYTLAMRLFVADRHHTITGQENLLIENEVKNATKAAKEGEGHAPELLLKIVAIRDGLKGKKDDESLRGIVSEVRSLQTSMQWQADGGSARAQAELSIVERQLKDIQEISRVQQETIADLEKEQELFRKAMNERLEFYRQLQAISDTVAPYKEDLDESLDNVALANQVNKEGSSAAKLSALKTKRRFLLHLRNESTSQTEGRICVICTDPFERGVLTVCGHQYCKDCIRAWWSEHRTCPECRRRLHLVDFHDITYKPQELRAQEEATPFPQSPSKSINSSGVASPSSSTTSIYSDISTATMDEIKAIDLNGSYGTKIDTIARHILWLREHDPGAKSIIFSQYSDFLSVLSDALKSFKIGFVNIRDSNGVEKFRKDPSLECFLLDAKSDSSGLNLVNATHVFLCEPLINAAIELQAIARVHRIGQFRPTMVYMYLIEDTVEEAIYDISVGRRLAHIGNARSAAPSGSTTPNPSHVQESILDKANSMELQQKPVSTLLAKGKYGGEIVNDADLWNCLFRKAGRAKVGGLVSDQLRSEVDRHLRAEAAEGRVSSA